MAKHKYIETPEKMWELPFKKNLMGEYVIFPNHIGGKNCLRDLAAKNTKQAYVYFLNIVGTNKYKIGVSTNPKRRLRDIASYIPFQLNLLSIHLLNDPYKVEQKIIDENKKLMIRNEWFEMDVNTAKNIMIDLHNMQVYESR